MAAKPLALGLEKADFERMFCADANWVNVAGAGESGVRSRTGSHGECDQAEGIYDHAACSVLAMGSRKPSGS